MYLNHLIRSHTLKLAISAALAFSPVLVVPTQALSTQAYDWKNVRIDGGGFVPGIIFNESEPNLIYARTDIGGAYRWEETDQRWIPLMDWVGWDNWGWNGVLSIATDPVDPDRLYAALGMYTNNWDPNNGAIARSSNRGETWEVTELPFKVGGNMPGRGMGERLRVDPNDNSTVYFGAELGMGLWRSTDYGETWNEVTNFPNPGTYIQDPTDTNDYLNTNQGVVWVTFDKNSGTPGTGSQHIFVGVADKEHCLYQSLDGGASWDAVPGAPSGYIPHKGVVDHENGFLYIASSDTGGPYDGEAGEVWKYSIATSEWTDITPMTLASGDLYFGYGGLTIDRQNPGTLMVASVNSWWPDMILFRTTDSGANWTRIWDWDGYPARAKRYDMDISETPWLTFGSNPQPPEEPLKLGWMNESVQIDPFNSDRFMYGTGATIYGANNLTAWDANGTVNIIPMIKGLEETAVLDLVSPPEGAPLFSALGDIAGFKHDDIEKAPAMMYQTPDFGTTTSIDFAEQDPSIMVRVGHPVGDVPENFVYIGVSSSGGDSWWQASNAGTPTGGGTVALAANGGAILWSPGGANVHYSTTYGSSWTQSEGIPQGAKVEADRVNPSMFYGFSNGTFYYSTDGGASFSASEALGLPTNGHLQFKTVAGYEGHIWLAGGEIVDSDPSLSHGLWRSTDGGITFKQMPVVEEGDNVAFGKAAPGADYPAVYIVAQVEGVRGVFRSDNQGESWVRINDDAHQFGNMGEALAGDPRVYGRVYLGTNGRGIMVAEPAGGVSSSSQSSVTPPSSRSSSSVNSSVQSAASSSDISLSSQASSFSSVMVSSSSTSQNCDVQCNWYGEIRPVCELQDSGWGWENNTTCIGATTCNDQWGDGGVISNCSNASEQIASSSAPLSSSSSVAVISSASSIAASSANDGSSSFGVSSSSVSSSSVAESSSAESHSSSSISANTCTYEVSNEWGNGYTALITVTNMSDTAVSRWSVNWEYAGTTTVGNSWNARVSGENPYMASDMGWNGPLQPGQSASFGFQGSKSSGDAEIPTVRGDICL